MTLAARVALALALLAAPPLAVAVLVEPPAPADLVYVSGPEPETLDPAQASRLVDVRLVSMLVEPLTALDPATLAPRPAAAATWTADARGVTFALAPDLRFSNGERITAEDFVAAWRRAADPATGAPLAALVREVAAGARALDPGTVRVEPARPRSDLLALLSLPAFAPLHRPSLARHGERFTRPGNFVSSGPFVLAAHEPGRRLRLVKNPRWRRAAEVRLGAIEALTTGAGAAGGDMTAFQIYETGGADLTFAVPGRAAAMLRAERRPDLRERPGAATVFLRFNTTRAPLAPPRARAALSAAIPRAEICRHVLRGGEVPAETLVPPGFAGYDPPAPATPPASPPPPTVTTLAGVELGYLYPASDEAAARIGEVLQAGWAERFGLRLRLLPAEPKAAFAAVRALEYDVAFGSWVADYPDPVSFLDIFRAGSGNNRTGFTDEGYDALLDRAMAEADPARHATLRAAEARLLAEAPLAPLYRGPAALLARPGLAGADAVPFAHAFPWAELRWSAERP